MNTPEALIYISVLVIAISLFFIGTELTGFSTVDDTGVVNVTVSKTAGINFSTDFFNFGSGAVTPGQTAIIYSNGTDVGDLWEGTITPGHLTLENIGNTNVSLTLKVDKTPESFIGATAGNIQALVTNTSTHTGACIGTNTWATYQNITTVAQDACGDDFGWDGIDKIDINFKLTIPSSADEGEKTIEVFAEGSY